MFVGEQKKNETLNVEKRLTFFVQSYGTHTQEQTMNAKYVETIEA